MRKKIFFYAKKKSTCVNEINISVNEIKQCGWKNPNLLKKNIYMCRWNKHICEKKIYRHGFYLLLHIFLYSKLIIY